jgi:hypothetical protein
MKNEKSVRSGFVCAGKTKKIIAATLTGCLVLFFFAGSLPEAQAATKKKTVENMIIKSTDDSDETIKAVKNGDTYTIDASNATLKKEESGSKSMDFQDFKKGDVINVKGTFDSRDVTATEVRDLSTTKSATLYGVVGSISAATQTVKIKTKKRGTLTVAILKSTKVTYDGKKRKFADIRETDKVLVTGTWNSSKHTITRAKKFSILVKDDYKKLN